MTEQPIEPTNDTKAYIFKVDASCQGNITIYAKDEEQAKEILNEPSNWDDNYFYNHKVENVIDMEVED